MTPWLILVAVWLAGAYVSINRTATGLSGRDVVVTVLLWPVLVPFAIAALGYLERRIEDIEAAHECGD